MKYCKLRIVWSVAWGVVAVLQIVLWVRSYKWVEVISQPVSGNQSLNIGFVPGLLAVGVASPPTQAITVTQMDAAEWPGVLNKFYPGQSLSQVTGGKLRNQSVVTILVPFWIALSVVSFVAASSWLPWPRYSFRALVIATIMEIVALGAAVWIL